MRTLNNAVYYALQNDADQEYADSLRPTRSFVAGWEGLKGSFNNTLAAGSRLVGADQTAQEFEEDARRNQALAAGIRGAVPEWDQADGLGDYATIASDWVLGNAPLMATMVTPAGAGRAVAMRLAAPAAHAVGGETTAAGMSGEAAAAASRAASAPVWTLH